MRILLALILAAAAQPAWAQLDPADRAELMNQRMLDQQRQVALDNQLMSLEAQARADRAVAQSQRPGPSRLPDVRAPVEAMTDLPAPVSVGIPEDRLAQSRRNVEDAARNRR